MRKEIIGICLFFLVILTLISLVSYHPRDPSINHAVEVSRVHNLFGVFGAHLAGLLLALFGLGSFWVPVLLLLFSIQFFGRHPGKIMLLTLFGGILLIISTGSLLSLRDPSTTLLGTVFSSGGFLGSSLSHFLLLYTSPVGATLILFVFWLIGLIASTGFSVMNFLAQCQRALLLLTDHLMTRIIKWKERFRKSSRLAQIQKEQKTRNKPEIKITALPTRKIKAAPMLKQDVFDFMRDKSGFQLPSIQLLEDPETKSLAVDDENLKMKSKLLEKKLEDFGVKGEVTAVSPGPVITTFEYKPAPGIKINKVVNLSDDLALALRAMSIRIVAPIPGKDAIGIEIPNADRETVRLKEIIISKDFEKSKSPLTICLGKDIVGNPVITDLNKMPHLLIAGATGSGKSVGLNGLICSLLYKASPDEVKLIMIDPKRIELSSYDGIPHLITPVVTDSKKATNALFWAVREMERRYEVMSRKKVRNIRQYNQKVETEKPVEGEPKPEFFPYIIIIIDELADLMMVSSRDVEVALTRLAQMARAAGIHLILATQRPSVDVLTGIIKANFQTRIAYQVSSKTDSRTILDGNGAENLLGNGDMLFLPPGTAKLQRIHGAYISESEVNRIADFLRQQKPPEYNEAVIQAPPTEAGGNDAELEHDEHYDTAIALVTKTKQASISMIQRHLRIGYNRAARIVETMEAEGIVGPSDGVKPREVLVKNYDGMP
ncbi:MAG: DNA translocase FtsK 4TM domain-containing protein [Proteobacteria bacterium]|nr:DNA translocase FtsK 4TM domain-containing protein [Pseudomonadota bacterium]MBU4469181.1 DNA translocase FtsK 4TM domain-containing protein [Pseudomonadota bacterium]MCG2752212.1 DNA translocase FtsK 4TM domain-containing protein [Desulfobacteraceae bacterium]